MRLFTRLHARLARGSGSEPAAGLGERDALAILAHTAARLARGWLLRPRLAACGGRLLVGRGARVSEPWRVRVGRGVKIEALAEVQGLARRGVVLGDGVTVGRGASIRPSSYYGTSVGGGLGGGLGEGLAVGEGSAIGPGSWIGASGFVSIGRGVLLGPRVVVIPENHAFGDSRRSIKEQGVERAGVVIEDDCWLGANVTVLAGVTIGRGSVVAAGAVVTRDVPPGSVVAGVPARALRTRGAQESAGRTAA